MSETGQPQLPSQPSIGSRRGPGRPRKEVHSEDFPLHSLSSIGDDLDDRERDIIVADEDIAAKDYLDALAFMEEPVTIVLHKGREKHSPRLLDFYVNGRAQWIPVEEAVTVPRKYLEVIARSQPMSIRTDSGEDNSDSGAYNKITRSLSSSHAFTVVKDANPKGMDWLAKVMRGN